MSLTTFERDQYLPDGKIWLSRSPLLLLLPALGSVLVGFALHLLLKSGWYLIILASFAAGGLLAGTMYATIRWTHCRNPWLSTIIGASAGVTAYLAFFYFGMAAMIGPAATPDMLPAYIKFRMATDVQADVAEDRNNKQASPGMNWFTCGYEMLIIVCVSGAVARQAARQAYDRELNCWMKKDQVRLQNGARDVLEAALQNGTLEQFLQSYRPAAAGDQSALATVTLEYTVHPDISPLEHPIYLSAVEAPLQTFFRSLFARQSLLIQKEITAHEAIRFQKLFGEFAKCVGARHTELANVRPDAIPAVQTVSENQTATEFATVEGIPEQQRLYLFSGRHLLMQNLCGGLPLFLLGGAAGLGWLATSWWDPALPVPAIIAGIVAAVLLLPGFYLPLNCPLTLENVYSRKVTRNGIARRAERIIDPDNSDAFNVALTRRERWQKTVLETATDGGLALWNDETGELRMECDIERYLIPRCSIRNFGTEYFCMPIDPSTQHWFVRLLIQTREAEREVLLCESRVHWGKTTNAQRQQAAEALMARLQGNVVTQSPSGDIA